MQLRLCVTKQHSQRSTGRYAKVVLVRMPPLAQPPGDDNDQEQVGKTTLYWCATKCDLTNHKMMPKTYNILREDAILDRAESV